VIIEYELRTIGAKVSPNQIFEELNRPGCPRKSIENTLALKKSILLTFSPVLEELEKQQLREFCKGTQL